LDQDWRGDLDIRPAATDDDFDLLRRQRQGDPAPDAGAATSGDDGDLILSEVYSVIGQE